MVASTYLQVGIEQYCQSDFLVTLKTDHVADGRRNAQFSLKVDNGGSHIEFGTRCCRCSSNFPA